MHGVVPYLLCWSYLPLNLSQNILVRTLNQQRCSWWLIVQLVLGWLPRMYSSWTWATATLVWYDGLLIRYKIRILEWCWVCLSKYCIMAVLRIEARKKDSHWSYLFKDCSVEIWKDWPSAYTVLCLINNVVWSPHFWLTISIHWFCWLSCDMYYSCYKWTNWWYKRLVWKQLLGKLLMVTTMALP